MRRFDITAAGDISYCEDGACVWFHETQEGEASDSLRPELVEARRQLTAYQIAKDNLELRLAKQFFGVDIPEYIASPPPAQVY